MARVKVDHLVTALDLPGGGAAGYCRRWGTNFLPVSGAGLADTFETPRQTGRRDFREYLVSGDREAMLRPSTVGGALNAQLAVPNWSGKVKSMPAPVALCRKIPLEF
jgi:hypothetical protein